MKKLLFSILFIFFVRLGFSQPTRYGNEWIDYTKTYAKVYVTADGMYRIPYHLLDSLLPNLSAANPANFQIVHNGLQVPIYVYTTAGAIDSNTYIEFFGRKNIGDVDSVLFFQSGFQPHQYYSCFTDTSVYFLTVNNQTNNSRFTFLNNDTASMHSLSPEPYFWYSSHINYTAANGTFSAGRNFYTGGDYIYKCIYDKDEAWGSQWIYNQGSASRSITNSLATPSVDTSGPMANLTVNIFTRSWEPHNVAITFNLNPLANLIYDNTYGFFPDTIYSTQIRPSSLAATNTIKVNEAYISTSNEEELVMFEEILYPRLFQFGGASNFEFSMAAGTGERYFQVSNFSDGGSQPLLFDVNNGMIIRSTEAPGVYPKNFVIPPAAGPRQLYLMADIPANYTIINRMDTTTFQNYTSLQAQGNYMVVSNKILCKDSTGHNWVNDYVNYRSRTVNPANGLHFDAHYFDYDQLVDQFGYGVKQSSLAIRNFVEYAYDHWQRKPEYLFLIGKGITYYQARVLGIYYAQNFVPSFGQPPSDNLLACRRGSNRPLVAVGRLAARFPNQVQGYLEKIMEYEKQQSTFGDPNQTRAEKLWMKQVMHLSGGSTTDEQSQFLQFLQGYQAISQDSLWGANTYTVQKTTSQPIDNSQATLIRQLVDSGISLMTFFGHAAATAFDISIDNPEVWTNYSKYPMIFSNGCYAGSIDDPNPQGITGPEIDGSYSERFVLTPGKAAIGFTATSGLSVSSALDNYGLFTYGNFCQNYYNKPWSKALQYSMWAMDSLFNQDDFWMAVAYEMTLHGDPAITINQYNLPDYDIEQSSVFFTPSPVTAGVDSFNINVIAANLGKAIHDTINLTITRYYQDPNNPLNTVTQPYVYRIPAPMFLDTFSFRLPTSPTVNAGFGQNQFTVFIESGQKVPELSETNNGQNLQFSQYIDANDILPIYPYQYAIVGKQGVTVKASTADPFAKLATYRLQVDTSGLFLHPLAQTTVTQTGGIIHWTLPITFADSTVYYWRVSRDSINDTLGFKWHSSSFVYIRNEYPGWNQSHYYQYQGDIYQNNVYLAKDRNFDFQGTTDSIVITNGFCKDVGGLPFFTGPDMGWSLNSSLEYVFRMGGCGFANSPTIGGFTFAVLDTVTNKIWQALNPYHGTGLTYTSDQFSQYGSFYCANQVDPEYGFDFNVVGNHPFLGIPWSQVIMNFLDSIPNGCIVLMYSVNKPNYRAIDPNLVNRLVAMGATGLRNLCLDTGAAAHAPAPYAFWTMKGNPAWGGQKTGTDYTQPMSSGFKYHTLWNKGGYNSPLIGPSTKWGSFHWRWRYKSFPKDARQSVSIYGVQANGTQVMLFNTTALDTTLSFINAKTYPYLALQMNVENDSAHVPSQLYWWRVLYNKVPEAAINPAAFFQVQRDTIGLGDTLNVQVALENVTELSMDSMRTQYSARSMQNGAQQVNIFKQDSLRAFDTLILKYRMPFLNQAFVGKDQLIIEANPEDALHQPEEYHFNNYAVINFSETGDKLNPLLDVTFDGRRVVNGDLVSAKPNIIITQRDNNPYLALKDTSEVQVYLRYPGQQVPTLINYDNSILTYYPANGNISKRNEATVIFKPNLYLDGSYDLLVRDKDASGNYSSNSTNRYQGTSVNGVYYDYKISFNVINKSMITNVLNYPNPFSTRTQFIFTLTGSEIPTYMKIQIMTITGKVVKEITQNQLGPIHIGTNITEYYWDGRDQYGDKLANGVYFYRVLTDINNKQVDHMSTSQYGEFFDNTNFDKYFKNGFGKMVIMR